MAYKKKLATISIVTPDGNFTVKDETDCMKATDALSQLKSGRGVNIETEDGLYWVNASSVSYIKISYEDSEEIEPSNPC